MSYFGNALSELLNRKNMRAVRLSELSGVGQPTISRYVSGEQTFVSPEDLSSIAGAISNDPSEQAELIRAHLLDECQGPGSKLVEISVSGHVLRELATPYQVKLPDDLEHCLATIREHVIKDKNVREIIEGLGNLLRYGDCRTNEERKSNSTEEELTRETIDKTQQALAGGKSSKKKRDASQK